MRLQASSVERRVAADSSVRLYCNRKIFPRSEFILPKTNRAACCRSHVPSGGVSPLTVPSGCIVNNNLRRTINFTSSRQLSGVFIDRIFDMTFLG